MFQSFTIITSVLGLGILLFIIWLVRKDFLHARYAAWWFVAGVVIAVVGIFPVIVDVIGGWLGVKYPPILALVLGFCLLVVKVLVNDLERSDNKINLRLLSQKVAILEQTIEELNRKNRG